MIPRCSLIFSIMKSASSNYVCSGKGWWSSESSSDVPPEICMCFSSEDISGARSVRSALRLVAKQGVMLPNLQESRTIAITSQIEKQKKPPWPAQFHLLRILGEFETRESYESNTWSNFRSPSRWKSVSTITTTLYLFSNLTYAYRHTHGSSNSPMKEGTNGFNAIVPYRNTTVSPCFYMGLKVTYNREEDA